MSEPSRRKVFVFAPIETDRECHARLEGGVPDNVHNPEVLPRWRERFGGKPAD